MITVTSTTTDAQIAVHAAAIYYRDGAPPELCSRLVNVARYVARLPEGAWPETVQGLRQARETFDRLDMAMARSIAAAADRMTAERDALAAAAAAQAAADAQWHGHPVRRDGQTVYVARRIVDGEAEYLGGKYPKYYVSPAAAVAAVSRRALS